MRSQDCGKAQCGVPARSVKTAPRPSLEGDLTRAAMCPRVGEDGKGARGGDRSWVRPCPPGLGGGRDTNGTVEGDSCPGFPVGVHGPFWYILPMPCPVDGVNTEMLKMPADPVSSLFFTSLAFGGVGGRGR